jgi:hypothetical protein
MLPPTSENIKSIVWRPSLKLHDGTTLYTDHVEGHFQQLLHYDKHNDTLLAII